MKVPLTISVTFPEASRKAALPANIANTTYDIMDIVTAINVPLGIAEPASFRSPQIFAPAWIPVTLGK